MTSINDVAKLAKVSKSTVSLVVNNTGYVSEKTRKKVLDAMDQLAYVPNQLGKNLSNKRSNIIGVVIPDVTHPFFAEFVKILESILYEKGFMLLVCSTLGREEVELDYLKWLDNYTIDGIVMGVHTLDVKYYIESERPIVSLDRHLAKNIPTVSSNHHKAAKLTVNQLCENNCSKVVQFVGSSNANVSSEKYAKECKKLFEDRGHTMITHVMKKNTFVLDEYLNEAKKAFEMYEDVDGFIGTDMIITQCLKLSVEKNMTVPDDLKLISYDGTQVTRMTTQQISCVKQDINELANQCADNIINLIEYNTPISLNTEIDVTWVNGDTTKN